MAESYKCPGCGAALVYQEGSKELVCPYCGTKVSIDELKQQTEKKKQKEQSEAKASAAGAQKGADSAQTAAGQTAAQSRRYFTAKAAVRSWKPEHIQPQRCVRSAEVLWC